LSGHFNKAQRNIMKKIGMIGLGMMGHGIAKNIIKHGYPMLLLEHSGNQPVDDLVAAGGVVIHSAAALAEAADIIILCVTGTPEVEYLMYRKGGLLQGMSPGTIIIDCSTAIPSSTVRIAESVEKAGGHFLDAPMTRTPKEAAEGRLNLIVGGNPELFEICKPVLSCFAENVAFAGPVGSGHRLKLLHNFVSLGFSAVLAEAAASKDIYGDPCEGRWGKRGPQSPPAIHRVPRQLWLSLFYRQCAKRYELLHKYGKRCRSAVWYGGSDQTDVRICTEIRYCLFDRTRAGCNSGVSTGDIGGRRSAIDSGRRLSHLIFWHALGFGKPRFSSALQ
jgi:hypothetical protein